MKVSLLISILLTQITNFTKLLDAKDAKIQNQSHLSKSKLSKSRMTASMASRCIARLKKGGLDDVDKTELVTKCNEMMASGELDKGSESEPEFDPDQSMDETKAIFESMREWVSNESDQLKTKGEIIGKMESIINELKENHKKLKSEVVKIKAKGDEAKEGEKAAETPAEGEKAAEGEPKAAEEEPKAEAEPAGEGRFKNKNTNKK